MTRTVRRPTGWTAICLGAAIGLLLILGALFVAAPREDGAILWTAPLMPGGWMAWTLTTALFFYVVGCLLVAMTLLAVRFPETPRRGILGIETTRGDRLFISLLGAAFICLIWLGLVGPNLWGGLACALIYAAAVFRWV